VAKLITGLTGATGVLGRRITSNLKRGGYEVVPYVGDIRDQGRIKSFVKEVDSIIHAAAMVPVTKVEANLPEAIDVNVLATAHLAETAARQKRRFAYVSTSHVYSPDFGPLSESAPVGPSSLYGLTKLQGEQWVRALCEDHLIMRLFSYFDEHQPTEFLINSLRKKILEAEYGATIVLSGANNVRDIATAEWLAERCVRLVLSGACGTINLCTGQARTVMDIARTLASELGREDIVWQGQQDGPPNSLLGAPGISNAIIGDEPEFILRIALAQAVV